MVEVKFNTVEDKENKEIIDYIEKYLKKYNFKLGSIRREIFLLLIRTPHRQLHLRPNEIYCDSQSVIRGIGHITHYIYSFKSEIHFSTSRSNFSIRLCIFFASSSDTRIAFAGLRFTNSSRQTFNASFVFFNSSSNPDIVCLSSQF